MLADIPARQRTNSECIPPKSPTLVAKILVTNSPKLLPIPQTNDMKRGSLQGSFLNLFKKPENINATKLDDDLLGNGTDSISHKRDKTSNTLHVKHEQRSSVRKSQNNLLKDNGSKNLDNNNTDALRRGSLATGALAETLDTSFSANKDNHNSSRSMIKNNEGYNIKKNLLEQNHLSSNRFLTKQKSVVVKDGFGNSSPAEGLFDSVGDNSRGDGRVLMSITMRRRSCHCSDCGGMSSLEKKHLHITIPCDRVQKRVNISLALKYQESQSNNNTTSHSPGHSTPRQRGQSKDLTFSTSTTQPATTSKKFLTVVSSVDKEKPSNLSRFAAVAKKSFTTQAQFDEGSQATTTAINTKSNVNVENNGEDVGHHTATAGSDVSVKTPARFMQKSRDSVENDGTPIKGVPSLARINSLEVEKDKKLNVLSKNRSTGEPLDCQESFSPVNVLSPKSSTNQQARQLKPALLMNVLTSQKFFLNKTRMSPTEAYDSHRFDDPKHLAQGFSRKVEKANRKPHNTLKMRNLSIIETYTNPVQIPSPLSANCKTVHKTSITDTLETAASAGLKPSDFIPRTSVKSKLLSMTGKKGGEPKSAFYKRSNTQSGSFLPNLVTGEVQKDIQSHRDDFFKNPFKLEASQEVIMRLKQKRGQSIECPERQREEHNNSPGLGGKPKKKIFKAKHRKNKSNPIMLEDIKKVYLPAKSPGMQVR